MAIIIIGMTTEDWLMEEMKKIYKTKEEEITRSTDGRDEENV